MVCPSTDCPFGVWTLGAVREWAEGMLVKFVADVETWWAAGVAMLPLHEAGET